MTNWAEKRAAAQRERVVAQQIVDRHTDAECEAVWAKYIVKLAPKAPNCVAKMRKALPVEVAELLEPGELAKMMDEPFRRKRDDSPVDD